jgi:ribosomal protein S18 acetylase RimI-like enzyme
VEQKKSRDLLNLEIREEPITSMPMLGEVSIAFRIEKILEIIPPEQGLSGFLLRETSVADPYAKDYDQVTGDGPATWASKFDVSRWGLITARRDGSLIGGAAIAYRTPNLQMLDDRNDLSAIWDIRVQPESRGAGIGSRLFRACEDWARNRGCAQLVIETQNTNVPACLFYSAMGCKLGAINRYAYPALPNEIQLLWFKDLQSALAAVPGCASRRLRPRLPRAAPASPESSNKAN